MVQLHRATARLVMQAENLDITLGIFLLTLHTTSDQILPVSVPSSVSRLYPVLSISNTITLVQAPTLSHCSCRCSRTSLLSFIPVSPNPSSVLLFPLKVMLLKYKSQPFTNFGITTKALSPSLLQGLKQQACKDWR